MPLWADQYPGNWTKSEPKKKNGTTFFPLQAEPLAEAEPLPDNLKLISQLKDTNRSLSSRFLLEGL